MPMRLETAAGVTKRAAPLDCPALEDTRFFHGSYITITGGRIGKFGITRMWIVDSFAEEQIQAAIHRGEFDELLGKGKPLVMEDDRAVPEELRVAYRTLKNADCLPPEMTLRREIHEVESLLHHVETDSEQQSIRRLALLKARLAIRGREVDLLVQDGAYLTKLIDQFSINIDF